MDKKHADTLLVEIAWEVCNQVGGIYTVIRSKVPSMIEKWDENYCLIGPYVHSRMPAEFEPVENEDDPFYQAAKQLRSFGYEVHYGYWLVSGKPRVVLLNPFSIYNKLNEVKYILWEHHGISSPEGDDLINQVIAFGHLVKLYFAELTLVTDKKIIGHFHEWMAGTAIPAIRRDNLQATTVFTTHATLLGRYLAMNDAHFYDHLPFYDWEKEAVNFNIETSVKIERAAAHGAHVFTTVSEVTARECASLLGRNADLILPNGLNIERFTALHEFQNLHKEYKEKIHQFIMGHFFHSYSFDLDKTLYFFTSGRYEYKNKGFDLTLEALARLNWRMRQENMDMTVVMFFVTKQPYHSINPAVLQSRAVMEEIRQDCKAIEKQVGERLFNEAAASGDITMPNLNNFVDEYWRLRLRRTLQSWKSNHLPFVVTHNLIHDQYDDILSFLRTANLVNNWYDRVKIVYHPDFISPTNPLFGMEYGQFVRGCHLGIFPSYYEPWGYTPLESIASGVPAVTSDLSGFGDYILSNIPQHEEKGLYVVNRRYKSFDEAANQLTDQLYSFVKLARRERITQRNLVESSSETFDWKNLSVYYERAYDLALNYL
ncbi:MAG: glycosyltransferase [Sporocytophaga sp.]|uniref:glycosyltransferase n=1 Tax=Sporocytophaga sp. TaxID=2231183 RepID=UPI001B18F17B|nr:glycosyltransferase [Sporocytophaga sp.]MBO9700673.1 glycosyltransferase [Sporocytophaga sp.]